MAAGCENMRAQALAHSKHIKQSRAARRFSITGTVQVSHVKTVDEYNTEAEEFAELELDVQEETANGILKHYIKLKLVIDSFIDILRSLRPTPPPPSTEWPKFTVLDPMAGSIYDKLDTANKVRKEHFVNAICKAMSFGMNGKAAWAGTPLDIFLQEATILGPWSDDYIEISVLAILGMINLDVSARESWNKMMKRKNCSIVLAIDDERVTKRYKEIYVEKIKDEALSMSAAKEEITKINDAMAKDSFDEL